MRGEGSQDEGVCVCVGGVLGGVCVITTINAVSLMSSGRCVMRSVVQRMVLWVQLRLKLRIPLQRAKML